jgi:hypothetical protein
MNFAKVMLGTLKCMALLAFTSILVGANPALANDPKAIAETNRLGTLNQLERIDIRQSQLGEEKATFQERLDQFAQLLNQEEARSFSPTTKLTGQVSFSLSTSPGR